MKVYCLTALSAGLLLAAAKIFHLSLTLKPTDAQCVEHLSPWSPALAAVSYNWVTYRNPFVLESVFNGPPTPELEAAWQSLLPGAIFTSSQNTVVALQVRDIEAAGHSPYQNWTRMADANGEASNNSPVAAVPEMFLQLACLNFLRQVTYQSSYDYAHEPGFRGPEIAIWLRIDSCLQRLRRFTMCTADTTPWLLELKDTLVRNPDLDTLHYCRDTGRLIAWVAEHGQDTVRLAGGLLGYLEGT